MRDIKYIDFKSMVLNSISKRRVELYMRNKYERKAWYVDEDVVLEGYADKRGFHPNEGIQCGFDTQRFTKRMIGKKVFYDLTTVQRVVGDIEVIR